jgi:hypothetical protein
VRIGEGFVVFFGLAQGTVTFWGPFWPTTPEISAIAATAATSEALPFEITNRSVLFKIKDARLMCIVDLVYFIDADLKTFVMQGTAYGEGAIAIDPNVSYYCNSKYLRVLPNGAFTVGFYSTRPGLARPPMKILKMCVQIRGSYTVLFGNTKDFASAMFQWPDSPGGNQWIKGPIAFDTDQSKWIPPGSKLEEAWSVQRALVTTDGKLLPNALRCDWPTEN